MLSLIFVIIQVPTEFSNLKAVKCTVILEESFSNEFVKKFTLQDTGSSQELQDFNVQQQDIHDMSATTGDAVLGISIPASNSSGNPVYSVPAVSNSSEGAAICASSPSCGPVSSHFGDGPVIFTSTNCSGPVITASGGPASISSVTPLSTLLEDPASSSLSSSVSSHFDDGPVITVSSSAGGPASVTPLSTLIEDPASSGLSSSVSSHFDDGPVIFTSTNCSGPVITVSSSAGGPASVTHLSTLLEDPASSSLSSCGGPVASHFSDGPVISTLTNCSGPVITVSSSAGGPASISSVTPLSTLLEGPASSSLSSTCGPVSSHFSVISTSSSCGGPAITVSSSAGGGSVIPVSTFLEVPAVLATNSSDVPISSHVSVTSTSSHSHSNFSVDPAIPASSSKPSGGSVSCHGSIENSGPIVYSSASESTSNEVKPKLRRKRNNVIIDEMSPFFRPASQKRLRKKPDRY